MWGSKEPFRLDVHLWAGFDNISKMKFPYSKNRRFGSVWKVYGGFTRIYDKRTDMCSNLARSCKFNNVAHSNAQRTERKAASTYRTSRVSRLLDMRHMSSVGCCMF